MKVLSVIPGSDTGTNMIFARRQVDSLKNIGIEIETCFIGSRTYIPDLIRSIICIRKKIRSFDPDIIHANYGTMTAFLSAFSNRKPLVITFHGSDINKTPSDGVIKDFAGRLLSNMAALRASVLICVSRNVRRNLWWKHGIVEIIPCGINVDEFLPMDRKVARAKLSWGEDEKVVLFNANNPKIKRLDIACETIEIVKKRWPKARLQVLSRIDPDLIPVYLNASDCLLICSDSEGNPMIVREALDCNLPIVGIDVGEIAKVLRDVTCTFIVDKEPAALADAVCKVFICRALSDGRQKLIQKKQTEKDIAEVIHAAYERVLSNN